MKIKSRCTWSDAYDTTGDFELQFDTLCVGDTAIVSGMFQDDSLCNYSYYWNFGNNIISNLCHPSFSFQTPGNYTCYFIIPLMTTRKGV